MAVRFDSLKRRFPARSAAAAFLFGLARVGLADSGAGAPRSLAAAWARLDNPLLMLFLALAIAALLAVALLKRRHRPELLSVCLMLSILLHLFSLSVCSVVTVGNAEFHAAPKSTAGRYEVSAVSLRESLARESVRAELLKTDGVDRHARLEVERQQLPETKSPKTPAEPRETAARPAGRVDLKNPAVTPQKQALNEQLAAVLNQPVGVADARLAVPQQVQQVPQIKPAEPGAREKTFDVAPAVPAPPAPQAAKPKLSPAVRKDPSRLPERMQIELAAVESRQPQIQEALQSAAPKPAVDRVDVKAPEVAAARGPEPETPLAMVGAGADVKLERPAGHAPQVAGRRAVAAAKSADQPRMASESLAGENPARIEPRLQNQVAEFALEARAAAALMQPVQMSDVQPLVASARLGAPGQAPSSASAGQREWKASREKAAAPAAAGDKPQAEVRDAAPSKEPVRIALGSPAALAAPLAKTPALPDVGAGGAAGQPAVPALKYPASPMALAPAEPGAAGPSAAEPAPSDLAAVKAGGGLDSAPLGAGRVSPKRVSASQKDGAMAGTLVEGSVGGLPTRASPSAAVQDQLAAAPIGGGNTAGGGLADVGLPARAVADVPRGVSPGGGTDIQPAALISGRTRVAGVSAEAGSVARPVATGRSDGPGRQDSFVDGGGAGVAAPQSAGSAVAPEEQIASGTALNLAGGDVKVLAGRISVQSVSAEPGTGGGAGEVGGGPAAIAMGKVGGGAASEIVLSRSQAPGRAGANTAVEPSGTLVEGSVGGLATRASPSAAVQDQLAAAPIGGGNTAGVGLADVGLPARAVPGVPRAVSRGGGTDIQPAALISGRARVAGVSAEAGSVTRPVATGRSDGPGRQDSFVDGGGAGVAAPQSAGSAVAPEEQIATGTALNLAGGDVKVLAGRIDVQSVSTEPGTDGGAEGVGGGGEPAAVSVGKAGSAGVSDVAFQRSRAPGRAGSGAIRDPEPSGTMVGTADIQAAGREAAAGTVARESLAALNTRVSAAGSGGPVMAAPAVASRGSSAGGGSAEADRASAGPLQIAKAGGAGSLPIAGAGDGRPGQLAAVAGSGSVGGRGPAPMDVDMRVGAQPSKARMTSDIAALPSGPESRRSFLSVGQAPNPDFVPQKAIYQMRKPEKRRQFITELGGTAQTEEAVEQALAWLSRAQSDDGRWDVDGFKTLKECGGAGDLINEDVAVSGLALLGYLGAGYTHLEGAYQETVRKALDWLLNCEKEDGDIRGSGRMYGQAIATVALCESYSLTGDQRLLEPAQRAVQFIVNSQTPESGWRYAPQDDSDTSATGWQILALKSAQIAGIAVPEQTFRWTELWLDKVRQGKEGGLYSYKPRHPVTQVMTAEGLFCQLFMGEQSRTRGQSESIAFIMQDLPVWDTENQKVHIYYWYYATLSLYLSGAQEFAAWNAALTRALLQGRCTSGPAAGSWDPVCQLGPRGGRIYSSAIGTLCLEVYYRFLPLYKQKPL